MRVPIQVTCFGARSRLGEAGPYCRAARTRVCSSVGQSAPLIRVRSVVRIYPDPPVFGDLTTGAIAQLGEHLLCKQGVAGSIPAGSTRSVQRDTTHAPHRSMHAWSHVSRQTSRNALFKNSNLGMTPRIKLFQLEIRSVSHSRERDIPADFDGDYSGHRPRTIGVIWSSE